MSRKTRIDLWIAKRSEDVKLMGCLFLVEVVDYDAQTVTARVVTTEAHVHDLRMLDYRNAKPAECCVCQAPADNFLFSFWGNPPFYFCDLCWGDGVTLGRGDLGAEWAIDSDGNRMETPYRIYLTAAVTADAVQGA